VGIVIEPARIGHRLPKRVLSRVPERRVADVMGQAQSFREVLVQPQGTRQGAADLRDLETVGQADAEVVAVRRHEDLRLVPEPTERDGVDDPVAITLEGIARPACLLIVQTVETPARTGRIGRVRGQRPHLAASFTISCPSWLVQAVARSPWSSSKPTKRSASSGVLNGPTKSRLLAAPAGTVQADLSPSRSGALPLRR
jgi:hypothetical protein